MSNMLFASAGAVVIEFTPMSQLRLQSKGEAQDRACFMSLAMNLGLRYVSLPPEPQWGKGFFEKPMVADVNALRKFFEDERRSGPKPHR